ncbi:DNA polymerase III subunit gamma/tau [Mergibacter septicus]|uniref:DNA polymerase III subunit gamma/tau n=1 Tax=Mergibacter septicus TaxID=221402 RepID=UPI001C78FD3B|nr:DNA polymerase III subunit gamma/tau [Mergibacter septicus]QDJ12662.1 DNA polymerase III subunit gamma/tau [Mergibacter septicus]
MSYQVLARKWRPNRFSDVVGQEHVLTALANGLNQNRLHHAYLFSGTRGVGKTSIARLFAKGLNCETGITAEPCGKCDNCQAIEQGNFVDLIEIDAASRTKVEDTRELLDNVQYKPVRGRFKIYLIDEVHMLSRHSFNALLKTLEEPPEYVKFLLATTDPQKLPITVLSRCIQFHLKALEQAQITQHLAHILTQENIAYQQLALEKLAKAAKGSVRDALSLTDQAIAIGNGQVNLDQVNTMLGVLDNDQALELIQALAQANGEQMMAIIENVAKKGADWEQLLIEIAEQLHQIALLQLLPQTPDTANTQLAFLAKMLAPEDVQFYYQLMLNGRKDLAYAPDRRIGVEMTMLRALAFHPLSYQLPAATPPKEKIIASIPNSSVSQQTSTETIIQPEIGGNANAIPTQEPVEIPPSAQDEVSKNTTMSFDSPVAGAISALKVLNSQKNQLSEQKKKCEKIVNNTVHTLDRLPIRDFGQDKLSTTLSHLAVIENKAPTQPTFTAQPKIQQSTVENIENDLENEEQLSAEEYRWEWRNPELEQEHQEIRPSEIKRAILQEKTPELITKIIKLCEEQDPWSKLISELKLQSLLRQFALNSVLLEHTANKIVLGVPQNATNCVTSTSVSDLNKALNQYYAQEIQLEITHIQDNQFITPLELQRKCYQQLREEAHTALLKDPKLQSIQDAFDAKLDLQSIRPVG